MPLTTKAKKLAKQKINEIKENSNLVDNSYQDIINFNLVNNQFTDLKNSKQLADFLAYAYIVRQHIAKKDPRAMDFKDEFRQIIRNKGIGAKEFEVFCGTDRVLDKYTQKKAIEIVKRNGDLSFAGFKINNKINNLIKEYNTAVNSNNGALAEEKGIEILANAYMAKKSYELRPSPVIKALNDRFKSEILPSILDVDNKKIEKVFKDLEEAEKCYNNPEMEDNYFIADPNDAVQMSIFKFNPQEVEQNAESIHIEADEYEVPSINAEDLFTVALKNIKILDKASPEELFNVIKMNTKFYRDKHISKYPDADDLDSISIDIDNDEEEINTNVDALFEEHTKEINNLICEQNINQIANCLLAYNILEGRDDLGVEGIRNKASRLIEGTFEISKNVVKQFEDLVYNEMFKEEAYDRMIDSTKYILTDFGRHQKDYSTIAKYADALIKMNDRRRETTFHDEDTGEIKFESMTRAYDKERQDYLGLYALVRKNNENRSGWNKFFHPFQNKKEKNIIANLEQKIDKLGIPKENLDLIYNKLNENYNVSAESFSKKVLTEQEKIIIENDKETIPGLAKDTTLDAKKERTAEFKKQDAHLENTINKE